MANPSARAMPEEWFSIIMAVVAAIVAPFLIRYANWNQAGKPPDDRLGHGDQGGV